MGSPEKTRSSVNREIDEDVEVDIDNVRDDDDWDGDDLRKHHSNKHRKPGIGDRVDGSDGSGSKRSASDRYESRKRVSASSWVDNDRDDYDARKDSRSKQFKKNTDENTLDELSSLYQDEEADYNAEVGAKSGSRGFGRAEEREKKRMDSKNSEHDGDVEKVSDGDLRYSERWDSDRDKGPGYAGRGRRRRWDEPDDSGKAAKYGEDSRGERALERQRSDDMENGLRNDVGTKIHNREEMQTGSERSKRDDTWKRKQEKETRENETAYDNMRDWELPRRGRDRIDGRSGGRKDGNRTEAVKTSSKYGISNENYDVIEIQTKPFDHGKEDSKSNIPKHGDMTQQSEAKPSSDFDDSTYSKEERSQNAHGSVQSGEGSKDGVADPPTYDHQHSWKDDDDYQNDRSRGHKGVTTNRGSGGSLTPHGNQEPYNRNSFQGVRGNRVGRVGRGRPSGRDSQQPGAMQSLPLVGSPFGPLGLPPPGAMQSLPPDMSPAPVPPISPGVFIPPFQPPFMWPGARGVDMNMLSVPPGLPPVPGPLGPRFPPNLGNPSTGSMVFSPPGPGRGILPGMMGPNFNPIVPVRPQSQDKVTGGWVPPRTNAPPGKAPSRGEQNDYSQNFVDTGMRPQNFIRELELTSVVEDYPKLRELIQKKDEIVAKSASPPMYYKCDLKEHVLSPEFFGTKFDVILVDPPWEEYVHRAPGVTDHMEYWTLEEIMNLKIEAIADTPSFIFLWVGDGVGLEQGRQCLKKWGFRRCEDICWVKTNKTNATPGLRHDSHTLFQRSKEHCLMGIRGTVRRSTDGHIIHANIDTDVIIAEEPPYGSTSKPEDMYRIIEHFALGRRRLELFGEDHNIRTGWLTVGKGLSSSNFNAEGYVKNFADKDGKVWAGGGGRNPPPEAPHLVLTTPDIEALRPKSPMKNQQQLQQQQSASISLTTGNSSNRRPSPQNANMNNNNNQEASSSNITAPAPWASEVYEGRGSGGGGHTINMPSDDNRMFVDMYPGYNNALFGSGNSGEFLDYESHRGMNML